jgi:hypothetical protein
MPGASSPSAVQGQTDTVQTPGSQPQCSQLSQDGLLVQGNSKIYAWLEVHDDVGS